jgi:uncharacterized protein (DUF302 family)
MQGVVTTRSRVDVGQTIAAIRAEVQRRGVDIIAVVDHAAAARRAGLDLPDTQVLIFGDPHAGTPLMQTRPEIAVDLPLRVMVRDDGQPGSLVTWLDPTYLAERYDLPSDHLAALKAPAGIVSAALTEGST